MSGVIFDISGTHTGLQEGMIKQAPTIPNLLAENHNVGLKGLMAHLCCSFTGDLNKHMAQNYYISLKGKETFSLCSLQTQIYKADHVMLQYVLVCL